MQSKNAGKRIYTRMLPRELDAEAIADSAAGRHSVLARLVALIRRSKR
jgi:hypothetical protein